MRPCFVCGEYAGGRWKLFCSPTCAHEDELRRIAKFQAEYGGIEAQETLQSPDGAQRTQLR